MTLIECEEKLLKNFSHSTHPLPLYRSTPLLVRVVEFKWQLSVATAWSACGAAFGLAAWLPPDPGQVCLYIFRLPLHPPPPLSLVLLPARLAPSCRPMHVLVRRALGARVQVKLCGNELWFARWSCSWRKAEPFSQGSLPSPLTPSPPHSLAKSAKQNKSQMPHIINICARALLWISYKCHSLCLPTRRMRNVKQLYNVYAAWHFNLYAQLRTVRCWVEHIRFFFSSNSNAIVVS